jgi:hypothetical protein
MTDDGYDIDSALETATKRTRAAELDFMKEPPEGPEAVARAAEVERRAEEQAILADEALEDRIPPTGSGSPDPE